MVFLSFSNLTKRHDACKAKLTESTASDTVPLKINGHDALRADISGTVKSGIKVHYLGTVIKTDENIVYVLSWTLESKFAANRSKFEQLATAIKF